MKRILFDVPRWHAFLHRQSRGLKLAQAEDPPETRFEDELFDRIYAGSSQALPEGEVDGRLSQWAKGVHDACAELPDFGRLVSQCQGDPDGAGLAVESLVDQLKPLMKRPEAGDRDVRKAIRSGCATASAAVDELREARWSLGEVFGGAGSEPGAFVQGTEPGSARRLFDRLRKDDRLRRIALLAGRFKRIAARKRRSRVKHGADEVTDIGQGSELSRLLPVELMRLRRPRLRLAFLRDLTERRCLQYELTGSESKGRGPLVVCLDKSGSMDGVRDEWAVAVALALLDLAQRERRPYALLGFTTHVVHEAVVKPGERLPQEALFVRCSGGTDIAHCLKRGLDIIEKHPGTMRKADIVLVTDGHSDTAGAAQLRKRAARLDVSILGLGIGVDAADLGPWCDEAHLIDDLDRLDEHVADGLFAA